MTKSEAIAWANSRPRNKNLQYHVVPFNDGYCVITDTHHKRHPHMKVVYTTKGDNYRDLPKP